MTVTWGNKPAHDATVLDSVSVIQTSNTWYEWDITDLYIDWVEATADNYGLYLQGYPSNGEGHVFYSSEYVDNTSLRPILEVTVTDIIEWASGVSGSWDLASNWDPSVVPDSTRNVLIQPDNGLVVTGPAAAATIGRMTIGAQVSGVAELRTQNTGAMTITNDLIVEALGKVLLDGALSAG